MLTSQASVLGEESGSREKVETDGGFWNLRLPPPTGTPAIYVHTSQITHTQQGKKSPQKSKEDFLFFFEDSPYV